MIFHPHFCASLYCTPSKPPIVLLTKRRINSTEFYYPELFSNFYPRNTFLLLYFIKSMVEQQLNTCSQYFQRLHQAMNFLSFRLQSRCLFSNSIIPPFSKTANRDERMIKLVEDGRGSMFVFVNEKREESSSSSTRCVVCYFSSSLPFTNHSDVSSNSSVFARGNFSYLAE